MLLRPDFNLKDIYEIDLQELKAQGIKAIFFDLDSTIMISKSGEYLEETQKWLEKAQNDFFIAVISNNKKLEYLEKVRSVSNFRIIGNANKPSTKAMRKLLDELNIQPNETVIVGDRPLTDILAGKRLGAKTILVGSINAENEDKPTQFVRWLERRFIME